MELSPTLISNEFTLKIKRTNSKKLNLINQSLSINMYYFSNVLIKYFLFIFHELKVHEKSVQKTKQKEKKNNQKTNPAWRCMGHKGVWEVMSDVGPVG